MIQPRYDVVILGGGPAGLAAAISLRKTATVSILIVDAREAHEERIGESAPPELMMLLEQLGLTAQFRQDGHATCPGYASVWGRPDVGYNDFVVNPMGPAWRLNRRVFDHMLAQAAIEQGATLVRSLRFLRAEKATSANAGYRLQLVHTKSRQPLSVEATYVIDATGALARFAKALGVNKQINDQLFAQIQFANVRSGTLTQQTLLEATPQGWWYAALLPDQRVISMIVTERTELHLLQQDHYRGYEYALQATTFIGPALAALELTDPCYYTLPIYSSILEQIEGKDWIAVGDAASSYDPVAAQGIYKAISDGIAAGQKVSRSISSTDQTHQEDDSYQNRIRVRYQAYLQNRAYLYQLEQRWPDTPFWRNRHVTIQQDK